MFSCESGVDVFQSVRLYALQTYKIYYQFYDSIQTNPFARIKHVSTQSHIHPIEFQRNRTRTYTSKLENSSNFLRTRTTSEQKKIFWFFFRSVADDSMNILTPNFKTIN